MYRIDNSTSVAVADAIPAAGVERFFTEGNPAGSISATDVPSWWLNMFQEEIRNVLIAVGIAPDKADNTQLNAAIVAHLAAQNLAGHTDVTLTTPQTGEALIYDGAGWVNGTPASLLGEVRKVLLLNSLRDTISEGSAARLVNAFPDPYADLSGINTGASSNYLHNAAGAYLENPIQAQVSQAAGTAVGNMTAGGGLAAAFDDVTAQGQAAGAKTVGTDGTGFIGKDWGVAETKVITGVSFWGSSDAGVEYSGGGSEFVWYLKGSNAAPSYGGGTTLYTSGTVADANGVTVENPAIAAGDPYRYHWIDIDTNGAGWVTLAEVQFFEQGAAGDMVVVSDALTTLAVPTNGHAIALVEPVDTVVYGTDLKLFESRDGGAVWDELTVEELDQTTIDVNGTPTLVDVLYFEGALTGASETNGLYRWNTYNSTSLRLHGIAPEFS